MTTGRINQVCRCHPELQQSAKAHLLHHLETSQQLSTKALTLLNKQARLWWGCWCENIKQAQALLDEKHQAVRNIELTTWHQRHLETVGPKPQVPKLGWSMRCCFTEDVNTQRVSTSTYNAAEALQHWDSWRNKQQQDQPGPESRSNAGRLNPKPKLTEKTEQPEMWSSASHRGHQKISLAPLYI